MKKNVDRPIIFVYMFAVSNIVLKGLCHFPPFPFPFSFFPPNSYFVYFFPQRPFTEGLHGGRVRGD